MIKDQKGQKRPKDRFADGQTVQVEYSSQSKKKAVFGIRMKNSTQDRSLHLKAFIEKTVKNNANPVEITK